MGNKDNQKRSLDSIARDYFRYLGSHFPQQCASDEFYFFPRSETAVQDLKSIDNLSPDRIRDHVRYVRNLLREISSKHVNDLEEEIDRLLLKQSMESFLREFEDTMVWRSDPTLYVKIPLFAVDRLLSQRGSTLDQIKMGLLDLFAHIPCFLKVAIQNLHSPSEISLNVAVNMAQDVFHYHSQDIPIFIEEKVGKDKELLSRNGEVLEAWEGYKKALFELPARSSFATGEDGLKKILAVSLNYPKSPEEILEIARCAYQKTEEKLRTLASKIDSRKTWKHIIYEELPSVSSKSALLELYQKEVQALRRFFYSQDIMTFPAQEKLTVLQTPPHLQSLRAAAAYRAPLTGSTNEQGIFYITPGKEDLELIAGHCPYLSAHETYPGHHVLDHLRINHSNPVRRQIELPLFYEGWACYGEQLLDELGYVPDPRHQLIGLKRQLWRNLRAELDVKLQTGKITLDQAAKEIEILGFSSQRAGRQVRRFALTPGYQLCYFIGNYEISRLQEKFSPRLGSKLFYDTLLGGGQLPFHLVERRLEAAGVG
jgi:hypothetical protein